MTLLIKKLSSPNFDDRDPNVSLRFIVLHYTGMKSEEAALSRMCDPEAKVSAHYMIDISGKVFCLVDEKHRAWHAGVSFWQGVTDMNSASVGIELSNLGHEFGYSPFPDLQIASLKELMRDIMQRHNIGANAVLAHSDIAPTRKEDPGELFPWKELAKEGLGVWPTPTASDYCDFTEDDIIIMLQKIGYDCRDLEATLLAFQRRYYPKNLTGMIDGETAARLKVIASILDQQPPY